MIKMDSVKKRNTNESDPREEVSNQFSKPRPKMSTVDW